MHVINLTPNPHEIQSYFFLHSISSVHLALNLRQTCFLAAPLFTACLFIIQSFTKGVVLWGSHFMLTLLLGPSLWLALGFISYECLRGFVKLWGKYASLGAFHCLGILLSLCFWPLRIS